LISRLHHEPDASGESSPIYHMTAGGRTTWYDFAVTLLSLAHGPERQVQLTPIQTSEYPTPAARPAYSVLSNEKVATRFGVRLPDWESQLRLAFADWPSTR
jgi:dTDP-4-dehydrorhamnose reductase